MLVLNFPGNPSTECVELDFFEKIVAFAKEHEIWVIQDLAYADICFTAISSSILLQGAKDCS